MKKPNNTNNKNVQQQDDNNQGQETQGQGQEQENQGQGQKEITPDPEKKSTKEDNLLIIKQKWQTAKEELEKYKKAEKEAEQKKLEEKGEYQKLLKAKEEEIEKYKSTTKKQEAKSLALQNGLNPEKSAFFEKYILERLVNSEDLEASISELKTENPELFSTSKKGSFKTFEKGGNTEPKDVKDMTTAEFLKASNN